MTGPNERALNFYEMALKTIRLYTEWHYYLCHLGSSTDSEDRITGWALYECISLSFYALVSCLEGSLHFVLELGLCGKELELFSELKSCV